MRILGVDPGIARTGWAIVEKKNGKIKAIAYDCFETHKEEEMSHRLMQLHKQMRSIIKNHYPDVLAVEQIFFNTNAKTAFTVSQARGVILLAGAQKRLPNFIYTPLQVKMSITGYGRAEKGEVGKKIKKLLNLTKLPKLDDTVDALAVAITHLFANGKHTNKPYQKPNSHKGK